jgi:hypothetical protein
MQDPICRDMEAERFDFIGFGAFSKSLRAGRPDSFQKPMQVRHRSRDRIVIGVVDHAGARLAGAHERRKQ